MKRLDELRKQMHADSMEDLEKAAEAQGISFEDFKQNLKNNIITQRVIGQEVGGHITVTSRNPAILRSAQERDGAPGAGTAERNPGVHSTGRACENGQWAARSSLSVRWWSRPKPRPTGFTLSC